MPITDADLVNWFSYHAPADTLGVMLAGEMIPPTRVYEAIRDSGLAMARLIVAMTPPSADQTAAIRKIREAVWSANAAVACGGK